MSEAVIIDEAVHEFRDLTAVDIGLGASGALLPDGVLWRRDGVAWHPMGRLPPWLAPGADLIAVTGPTRAVIRTAREVFVLVDFADGRRRMRILARRRGYEASYSADGATLALLLTRWYYREDDVWTVTPTRVTRDRAAKSMETELLATAMQALVVNRHVAPRTGAPVSWLRTSDWHGFGTMDDVLLGPCHDGLVAVGGYYTVPLVSSPMRRVASFEAMDQPEARHQSAPGTGRCAS